MATRLAGNSGNEFWCSKPWFGRLWALWQSTAPDITPRLVMLDCPMYGYGITAAEAERLAERLTVALDDGTAARLFAPLHPPDIEKVTEFRDFAAASEGFDIDY
jgi:hypothetical protein